MIPAGKSLIQVKTMTRAVLLGPRCCPKTGSGSGRSVRLNARLFHSVMAFPRMNLPSAIPRAGKRRCSQELGICARKFRRSRKSCTKCLAG